MKQITSMISTLRSFRTNSPSLIISQPLPSNFSQKASVISLRKVTTLAKSSDQPQTKHEMDKEKDQGIKQENPNEKHGDVMSHSFGEGYSTRSEDDGFGGVYGGSDPNIRPPDDDKSRVHENHPDYDKTQGSDVKEKEKSRFQTKPNNW